MISNQIVNDLRVAIAAAVPVGADQVFAFKSAFPVSKLDGYPALVVMPSENNADYGSTAENRHSFAFELIAYYPVDEADPEKTERAMGTAVGELLRIFSQKSLTLTPETIMIRPVPSVWSEDTIGGKPYRVATVILTCVTYPLVG